jgi:hypothetical protein
MVVAKAKRRAIRRNVPIPEYRAGAKNIELLMSMGVNDSVEVADRNAANSLYVAARRRMLKLVSRQTSNGRIRVWRVQ